MTSTFCLCVGDDHSSLGIESQGFRSKSNVKVGVSKDSNAVV